MLKTFELTAKNKRTFRRNVRVFFKNALGKIETRHLVFTTEHLVTKNDRFKNAKLRCAQYSTADPLIQDAIFSDSAYGKDFYQVGDEKGENKIDRNPITFQDLELSSLKNLFLSAKLPFDDTKNISILKLEYQMHMEAVNGISIKESAPAIIQITPSNPLDDINNAKQVVRDAYKVKTGKEIPAEFANDSTLLSALQSNPDFDVESYIAPNSTEGIVDLTKEDLHQKYFDQNGTKVPNPKSNDLDWIKEKLGL